MAYFGDSQQSVCAGTITGYMMYDLTHFYIHHTKPSISYFQKQKHYHVMHHYKNPHLGYGVSNKLWDYVFGTVLYDDDEIKSNESKTK
jgi:sterol desaturase/sphingolipid hydroxylase (fatty acid hydroxylase superfamily)